MKIACIGFGSLIWEPKDLLVEKDWKMDGPDLPVEFLRQSEDGRLTLVISPGVPTVRTLWAIMTTGDLKTARVSLRKRERCDIRDVGYMYPEEEAKDDTTRYSISLWLKKTPVDAVIWTNLPEKFNGISSISPSIGEAVEYLKGLPPEQKELAEEYIRKTPMQITTQYRAVFEQIFGWTAL